MAATTGRIGHPGGAALLYGSRRMIPVNLKQLGWNGFFEAAWNGADRGGSKAARVVGGSREIWRLFGEFGEGRAEPSGTLRLAAEQGGDWPMVGDWVVAGGSPQQGFIIKEVLPRRSRIVRKAAGKRIAEQALAVNVDTAFVVMALDGDFSPRRLERYLAQVWESGSRAAILLNKTDVCANLAERIAEVERSALGVPTCAISATTGEGTDGLAPFLGMGETVVLLGSSGVGKSSIANRLLNRDQQQMQPVREHDSRGRHTTTGRDLFFLASGAMIIDTPGLRELQLWDATGGLQQAFGDLEKLSVRCRFRDCTHGGEPGCAIVAEISRGGLDPERLANYRKLQREQEHLRRKMDAGEQQRARQRIKTISRGLRRLYRQRDERGKP
jgi:ribosome biogenesis GTPase